jgi:hypothetical protein
MPLMAFVAFDISTPPLVISSFSPELSAVGCRHDFAITPPCFRYAIFTVSCQARFFCDIFFRFFRPFSLQFLQAFHASSVSFLLHFSLTLPFIDRRGDFFTLAR